MYRPNSGSLSGSRLDLPEVDAHRSVYTWFMRGVCAVERPWSRAEITTDRAMNNTQIHM